MGRTRAANPVDLTELFGDDARPRPADKLRPAKKTKLDGTSSTARSGKSDTLSELHFEFNLKRETAKSKTKRLGNNGV
ncbi:hypothetical protein Tco_0098676 [Tanacetum coccineum]